MINKEKVLKFIEQKATIYKVHESPFEKPYVAHIDLDSEWHINEEEFLYCESGENIFDLSELYETLAEAEDIVWRKSLLVERKPLDFSDVPKFSDIKKNYHIFIHNRLNIYYKKGKVYVVAWSSDPIWSTNADLLDIFEVHTEAEYKTAITKAVEEIREFESK
jgi:hypothetical protein